MSASLRRLPLPALCFVLATTAACMAPTSPPHRGGESETATGKADGRQPARFMSLSEYAYLGPVDREAELARLVSALREAFDNVCGDTFCEGDYSNLAPIAFECTVEIATETVRGCNWTFAGSYAFVDEETGSIEESAGTWTCRFLEGSQRSVDALLALASAPRGPLKADLDGSGRTIYDALVDCLP